MNKISKMVLVIGMTLCFAGERPKEQQPTLAVPNGFYTFNTITDLDSNKSYHGTFKYSASRKSINYLEDTWVNLEHNGQPHNPILFMNSNIDEEYKYMGHSCAFLNGGKISNYRIIICDEGNFMYIWEFYSDATRRYKFSNALIDTSSKF